MTNLLTFLAAVFYGGLAIIFTVAIIDHWRATRRPPAELTNEERLQKAA